MSKHVFEITGYGTCWHKGEYVGETNCFFTYVGVTSPSIKISKDNTFVIETNDPRGVERAYREAWKSCEIDVQLAEYAMIKAKKNQEAAARRAVGLGDK